MFNSHIVSKASLAHPLNNLCFCSLVGNTLIFLDLKGSFWAFCGASFLLYSLLRSPFCVYVFFLLLAIGPLWLPARDWTHKAITEQ